MKKKHKIVLSFILLCCLFNSQTYLSNNKETNCSNQEIEVGITGGVDNGRTIFKPTPNSPIKVGLLPYEGNTVEISVLIDVLGDCNVDNQSHRVVYNRTSPICTTKITYQSYDELVIELKTIKTIEQCSGSIGESYRIELNNHAGNRVLLDVYLGAKNYENYYVDSDGDGYGDYNSVTEKKCVTFIGEHFDGFSTNNLDRCINEYSNLNNGCLLSFETDINWIGNTTYNIKGELISDTKSYFDQLGKEIQTQTFDVKENRIWASQTMYDHQGRPALQTLTAPVTDKNSSSHFVFKNDFIRKHDNTSNTFTEQDFRADIDSINNSFKVGAEENTLGGYYSSLNEDEPYQDVTHRPYSKTIYSELNPGEVKQVIGGRKIGENAAGDGGEWKQGYTFTMPAAQEMYYIYGHDYFESSPSILNEYYENVPGFSELNNRLNETVENFNKQINWLKATKTIVQDVRGVESVVFTDTDGKTLASARVGVPDTYGKREKQFEVLSLIGTQKYVDIHIPVGCQNTATFEGAPASDFTVYNLKTEQPDGNISVPGFYRVEYTGNKALSKHDALTSIEKNSTAITPVMPDAVGIRYKVNYYDFSINYYNQVGQLTNSLQPVGFNNSCLDSFKDKASVGHRDNAKSTYKYNALGQLTYTQSPDEGEAWFIYREDGQIWLSTNSKQLANLEFSYTNYDNLGRPIESGVIKDVYTEFIAEDYIAEEQPIPFHSRDIIDPKVGLLFNKRDDFGLENIKDQQFTFYDYVPEAHSLNNVPNLSNDYKNPSFLAGNVALTFNRSRADKEVITKTYYSYDIYGRVKWIVQDIEGLGIKTIDYKYDPVTSQVLEVIFQKNNISEKFVHKYEYDVAQELVKVQTKAGNGDWITHADYEYYETGALKRTTLAEGIQGIDYVYNLSGQLKAINHPNLNTEEARPEDQKAGEDIFGMTIDYYDGDYKRNTNFNVLSNLGDNQYNGNIKGISWKTKIDNLVANDNPVRYHYKYNNNNWLTSANFEGNGSIHLDGVEDIIIKDKPLHGHLSVKASETIILKPGFSTKTSFTAQIVDKTEDVIIGDNDYDVNNIFYDANGNILGLDRNRNTNGSEDSDSDAQMDELEYRYSRDKPNQLSHIIDYQGYTKGVGDIGDQLGVNYHYNSIGQLVEDWENVPASEKRAYLANNNNKPTTNITRYVYNATGLVSQVWYNGFLKVAFNYNDKNYRTEKITYADNSEDIQKRTHYVLDAAGSPLAIYENGVQVEVPIYGASRLGIYKKQSNSSVYQLTDHLGNVRAVIAKQGDRAAAITSSTDYYPFGMPMPGRQIVNGELYRYAYQGQEKDPETGKEAFQLRLWDARIGRWLTTDPYHQYYSPYLGMGNSPINGVDSDGGFWEELGNWITGNGWISNIGLDYVNSHGITNYISNFSDNPFNQDQVGTHSISFVNDNNETVTKSFQNVDDFNGQVTGSAGFELSFGLQGGGDLSKIFEAELNVVSVTLLSYEFNANDNSHTWFFSGRGGEERIKHGFGVAAYGVSVSGEIEHRHVNGELTSSNWKLQGGYSSFFQVGKEASFIEKNARVNNFSQHGSNISGKLIFGIEVKSEYKVDYGQNTPIVKY